MKLILVRHSDAEDIREFARNGKPDSLRPLTKKGLKKMKQVSKGLQTIVSSAQILASSPWLRAMQTAESLGKRYDLETKPLNSLCGDSHIEEAAVWLKKQSPDKTIILVGHEPYLGRLASWLVSGQKKSFVTFSKGGACLIEYEGHAIPGEGNLIWHLKPSHLISLK